MLNTIYAFRIEWLTGADASNLRDFRIPFAPREIAWAQWNQAIAKWYEKRLFLKNRDGASRDGH